RQFRSLLRKIGRRAHVIEVESSQPSEAITQEGLKYGVVVLGAYAEASRSSVVVGSRLARTVSRLPGTVILAKRAKAADPILPPNATDATVGIARSYGVPVYQHSEILSELGSFTGKGEALWKSLHAVRGDIVVWCDTDISNIHPQFVYGTIGPLLTDPRIAYV